MKTLFITMGVENIYGAARSLSEVTKRWPEKFDMIVPYNSFSKDLLFHEDKTEKYKTAKESYGPNLDKLYYFWLPQKFPIDIEFRKSIKFYVKHICLIYLLGLIDKHKIYRLIRQNNYDIIHLNSVTLYPLLSKRYNMFLHVRCVVNRDYKNVIKHLRKAKGLFFIEQSVKKPLDIHSKGNLLNGLILINPFDMTGVRAININKEKQKYGIALYEKTYIIAGQIIKTKGVDFVINAFLHSNVKAKLLVVGKGIDGFEKQCKELSNKDNRIVFCGEQKDMIPFYAISDYIIRGDLLFGFGRTCYEALYAGKSIIVPGEDKDIHGIPDYEKYKDNIFLYKPRDLYDLTKTIEKSSRLDFIKSEPRSNTDECFEEFMSYIKSKVIV